MKLKAIVPSPEKLKEIINPQNDHFLIEEVQEEFKKNKIIIAGNNTQDLKGLVRSRVIKSGHLTGDNPGIAQVGDDVFYQIHSATPINMKLKASDNILALIHKSTIMYHIKSEDIDHAKD